jgi:hypothetical protein
MKIVEIKDITRKDVPIYYKRYYKGIATLDLMNKTRDVPLEFIIEHKPIGTLEITITLMENIDYPVVPLMKELKTHIGDLDTEAKLPL